MKRSHSAIIEVKEFQSPEKLDVAQNEHVDMPNVRSTMATKDDLINSMIKLDPLENFIEAKYEALEYGLPTKNEDFGATTRYYLCSMKNKKSFSNLTTLNLKFDINVYG